jgi:hypothetical protein
MPTSPLVADANQIAVSIPPVVSPDDNEIVKRRLKSASDLANLYQSLFNEDLESSRKRSMVDAAIGGEAPYDPRKERKLGTLGRSNINFGILLQNVEEAQMPFFRLLESLDTLCTMPLKSDFADEETRQMWEPAIAEEFSKVIKNWASFHPRWGQLSLLYVIDGIGFTLFSDGIDWRWQVKGLQHLKFPRDAEADVNYLDVVAIESKMRPDELLRKVQAEDKLPEGDKRYWNKQAVMEAVKQTAGSSSVNTNNPEEVVDAWKNNDISLSMSGVTVKVIHGYVRETDGTVSHYVSRYDGVGDFLYVCESKFTDVSQLMTAFIGNVGTNGDFHSIRGLGYKMFAPTTGQNRAINKFLDAAFTAATPHLSTDNEDANVEQSIVQMGPYNIMAKGTAFQETNLPDFSQTLIPALSTLGQLTSSRSAASSPVSSSDVSRTQKTKFQVQTETEQKGALQSSSFVNFTVAWQRHLQCVARRICREDYQATDPGGKEAWEFRNRLVRRGVPLEALNHIDFISIEANTGLGKGSSNERRTIVDALSERVGPFLDQKGQQLLQRWTVSAYAGPQIAKLLVPDQPGLRPPVDATIAQMENSLMSMGQPPSFEPNQDHVVHLDKHLQRLYEVNTQLTEMQIELRPAIDQMQPIWEHSINDHLPMVNQMNPDYKRFKEALQQLGELIKNSRKHLDAEDKRAAEEAGEAETEMYGGTQPGLFAAAVDANARAAQKDMVDIEKTRAQIQMDQQRHAQEMAATDVRLALEVEKARREKSKPQA